ALSATSAASSVVTLAVAAFVAPVAFYLGRFKDAQDSLRKTEKEILEIKFVLYTQPDRALRERSEEQCRQLLERYKVLDLDDWRDRPLFASLEEPQRERLAGEFRELP